MNKGKSVFHDPGGRRWRKVRYGGFTLTVTATLLAAVLIISIIINPVLPQLNLPSSSKLPEAKDTKPLTLPLTHSAAKARHAANDLKKEIKKNRIVSNSKELQHKNAHTSENPKISQAGDIALQVNKISVQANPMSVGFYVNWDDTSYASLKRNISKLDVLVPEWIRLQDGDAPLVKDIDPKVLDLIQREKPQLPVLPLVQNYQNEEWNPEILAKAVNGEPQRKKLINALEKLVEENKFGGICIDLEEVPASSQENLFAFMRELHGTFNQHGWIVAQAVPFDNPDWNYKRYADVTDYLLLMAYDQHWSSSTPGAIAAQDWYETTLARRMKELNPLQTIVCFGNYGYDWSQNGDAPEVSFQETVLAARDSEAKIQFDAATRNPYFRFTEEDGSEHTVWFLDAATAYNQIKAANTYHPAGYALWRLGSEDPSLWTVFGSGAQSNPLADGLSVLHYGYDVDFEGTGEILQVAAEPKDGARQINLDSKNEITNEVYTAVPSTYVIKRSGDRDGLVALTFDDGPDPAWTSRILDVLKEEKVPATFFVIGENGQENPQIIKRIVAEGHDLGNHSYTHPNLGEIPGRVTDMELNATQRLIESLTGRSTRLFRAPYFGDAEPQTPDEVEPAVRAQHLGYLNVGLHIDPDDWALPGKDEIVKRTVSGITNKSPDADQRGQIVLLHDGGGNRQQTLDALPEIIHELRAKGYRFVTVSELAGLSQNQTMPPVPKATGYWMNLNAVSFYALSFGSWFLHLIFLLGILLGLGRMLFIGSLALAQRIRSRRRETSHEGEAYKPFVSVIVPAYNEEKVISKTIHSLLKSDYKEFEILVVDDGSTDKTSHVVREEFADETRVRLFTKENAGKDEALNYGLKKAKGEIIIGLDADTIFAKQTIGALAHRFANPKIGAVAGNAKVGNRINIITRWQALEYVSSQNLDRRAFSSLNCITVVPGAVGAWRRCLIEECGGFSSDTLAEDQDLTLRIRKLGYEIGYEENAVAWTEAPDTFRGLAKQRFRWSFGTLQCMWKHRDALFNPRCGTLGFIAMPNVWLFQILFPLLTPFMDLFFIWSLIIALMNRLEHQAEYATSATNFKQVLFYYALFLAVDWLSAAFAFAMEKREQWRLLWSLLWQRFGYRQVMYIVMVRSVANALRGSIVGWNKVERKATVTNIEPLTSQ